MRRSYSVRISREKKYVRFVTHEYANERVLIRAGVTAGDFMGNSSSKKDPEIPRIILTQPTPVEENKPFAPSNFPRRRSSNYGSMRRYSPQSHPKQNGNGERRTQSGYQNHGFAETNIMAGTPPSERPPPLPTVGPPPLSDDETKPNNVRETRNRFEESGSRSLFNGSETPPLPAPRTNLPTLPTIKKNIIYAKDNVGKFESLNTTDRKKDADYNPLYQSSTATANSTISTKCTYDDYPIYNPIEDYSFQSGKTFHKGSFPIDSGAGKSTLINALRGINHGDPQSAGRYPCDNMEPFRMVEEDLQSIVLWEIPYPRTFTSVVDIYDRNMGFDRFYDSHKLHLFKRLFVLIPDGAPHDDDIAFGRVVHSRRTPLTLILTKSDDDIDAECRETGQSVTEGLLKFYEDKARRVFSQSMVNKARILQSIQLLLVSAPVIRNMLSGTVGYLHYKIDEDTFLNLLELQPGCHIALENKQRRETEEREGRTYSRPTDFNNALSDTYSYGVYSGSNGLRSVATAPSCVQKSTVLADAGFEILYGTDDRVFGALESKTTVVRAGKTAFNYGFIGGIGAGKSYMINAMRGMTHKHPLAAGRTKAKRGTCERYEFDDELLKYSVTLWELHYPKKISQFFEFIDRHNLANFTAIFILIDIVPSEEDLTFAKIAHRRNAAVVFLSSKSDKKLSIRSRADEIPVCDLLKQRFVDKGIARFDKVLSSSAPELCGRVHSFFVSAPVFHSLRSGDGRGAQFLLHERAVFDFLKQKRIIAEMLDSPQEFKEGLYANVNIDTAGVTEVTAEDDAYERA